MTRYGVALILLLVVVPARIGHAGPDEAERRLADAKRWKDRHWALETIALADAARSVRPRSALAVRALRSLGSAWKRSGNVHGALAAYAAASRWALPGESARYAAPLSAARLLHDEGDMRGATLLLERVARDAGRASPDHTERALAHLVEIRFEERDAGAVGQLVKRLERARASPAAQIVALGRLGELTLDDGDERGARATLRHAERVYEDAADDPKAAKAWLELPLRRRAVR